MAKRDYYEVPGLNRDAGEADIKKAYRRLAMKYHPDRNPDDASAEEKFKEATEAYEVLTDDEKRAAYDQFGHAGVDPSMGGGGQGFGGGGASFQDIFGDVFGDIFGGGRGGGGSRVQRGADLRYNLDIDLEDAVKGATVKIRVPSLQTCSTCDGSGAKAGSSPVNCTTCGGAGQVRMQQGFFSVQQTCPNCRGKGKTIKRSVDDVTIRGNLVVDTLDFQPRVARNFFGGRGAGNPPTDLKPTGLGELKAYARNVVEYDPALNYAAVENYRKHYRAFTAGGIAYWLVSE